MEDEQDKMETPPAVRWFLERHRPAGSAPSRARDNTGDGDEGIGDDDEAEERGSLTAS